MRLLIKSKLILIASISLALIAWVCISALAGMAQASAPVTHPPKAPVRPLDLDPALGAWPIGFYTSTVSSLDFVPGQTYTLLDGDSRSRTGEWAYIDFNARGGSAVVNDAWAHCGFNPTITDGSEWTEWANSRGGDCAENYSDPDNRYLGPTAHFPCLNPDGDPSCSVPDDLITYVPYLRYGPGTAGWWIGGSAGTTNSQCDDLAGLVNGREGDFAIPILDNEYDTGLNTRFHLRAAPFFHIRNSLVECHIPGPGGEYQHWHIEGIYNGDQWTPTPTSTRTPTSTPSRTPVTGRALVGHVTWQGRPAQPHALQQVPITLTLKLGDTEVNCPGQDTDVSGFFTVSLNGLADGVYSWRVKGQKYLANWGSVNVSSGSGSPIGVEIGLMVVGDANNDNQVNTSDFLILKTSYGRACGYPGYDDRADFTGNCGVNALDFNLLKTNFGLGGAPPILPGGP